LEVIRCHFSRASREVKSGSVDFAKITVTFSDGGPRVPWGASHIYMRDGLVSVFGIFSNPLDAADCIDELRSEGFQNTDISLLYPAPENASANELVQGALAWLAGVGLLSIPGLGRFVAAGPIVGWLSAAGDRSQHVEISSVLTAAGMPPGDAKRYESRIRRGSLMLAAHCAGPEAAAAAQQSFLRAGCQDLCSTAAILGQPLGKTS
jgi:hypothetical protein